MTESAADSSGEAIDAGSYDLLRSRLAELGIELARRADELNKKRIEVFGGQEMAVIGNERMRTENSCVPRDIVSVGDQLLFGYNVQIGMRKETKAGDVFNLHTYTPAAGGRAGTFTDVPVADNPVLGDPRFGKAFDELYRYYKGARLQQLRQVDGKLLAIFQVGSTIRDIKVLRWAVGGDGEVRFMDDSGARDHIFPSSHDFRWTETGRDDFFYGDHPHVSILDEVFVETVGGDLTVKIENNTADGAGVYSEPVDNADQTLDDGRIYYAKLGTLILLKVQAFGETEWRYLVFNTRTKAVERIDAIGRACVQLPEDHGIIFPGGYYLQSGETKTFPGDSEGMRFLRLIKSPNGEDVMYVFYEEDSGYSILLPYNMIRKQVQNPITCHGYAIFDNGDLVIFKEDNQATRVHPMQIWQTPFMSAEHAASLSVATGYADSLLVKIGNVDLVRGISETHSIRQLLRSSTEAPASQTYEDLIAAASRLVDNFYWLAEPEVGDLTSVINDIAAAGELVIGEFEKVQSIEKTSQVALAAAEQQQEELLSRIRPDSWETVDQFVEAMGRLRRQRGHVITLKELRYIDTGRLAELDEALEQAFADLSRRATAFLLQEDAFAVYRDKYQTVMQATEKAAQSNDLDQPLEALAETGANLEMLTGVVGSLQIDDPAARTRILEAIAEVMALMNRAKATALGKRKDLLSAEGTAEFGAQFRLFSQSVQSAMAMADTPEKCDEQLTRLMVQLEEIEGRFADFDEFVADLAQKREEVYNAFGAKQQQLVDERQRKADHIAQAAERILKGIGRRADAMKTVDELNGYFAADGMVMKIRDLSERLVAIGDSMRADEVVAKLKAARDNAGRSLRDKTELFAAGENLITLGRHNFSVNRQELQLTLLPRDGGMSIHLTGTGFFEQLEDERLQALEPYWRQTLASENQAVYRGEYLAACILFAAEANGGAAFETDSGARGGGAGGAANLTLGHLYACQQKESLLQVVREFAADRYDEGYERGVHDNDATLILDKLLAMRATAGLLRYAPSPRALACLFWSRLSDVAVGEAYAANARNLGRLRQTFGTPLSASDLPGQLAAAIAEFLSEQQIDHAAGEVQTAGDYLAEELSEPTLSFSTSGEAQRLATGLLEFLDQKSVRAQFVVDLADTSIPLAARYAIATSWFEAFLASQREGDVVDLRALAPVISEAAVSLMTLDLPRRVSNAIPSLKVEGVLGQHGRITSQTLELRFDEFLERLRRFSRIDVPEFVCLRALRSEIVAEQTKRLRIEEFKPRPLTSFVRNKLINDVYLPMVGDNLAKQIGAEGDAKRTDLMGLLLLISPPGYGKTTLMEYIADRLGLTFMKINGPALGHDVTSLDPNEAPNATARQEVEKLNLALEMGNNVMLYLDDIQHTHTELLQKFISLCDAQRRIEGVWKGRTKTYDMRGRRFCVVMAGNPYTESGDRFQIPDMLANRADVYNLGDVLSGNLAAFELSYVENSMTSNSTLSLLATREQSDVYAFVRMAQGQPVEAGELKHSYSKAEQEEIVAVLQKMFVARDVLLLVNNEYIASAAQDERFRAEPKFQLQGSYRNMNKLAEKIVAVMSDEDLQGILDDHYAGEAQTLTSGAEANILKLRSMRGVLTEDQAERWQAIKAGFQRHQLAGGGDDDPVTRVSNQLGAVAAHLQAIGSAIEGVSSGSGAAGPSPLPRRES